MNHSIRSADRATHVRIVATAMAVATIIASVGIATHVDLDNARTVEVAKAEKLTALNFSEPDPRSSRSTNVHDDSCPI